MVCSSERRLNNQILTMRRLHSSKLSIDPPLPDTDALAHSARLSEHIRAEMDGGALPFRRYMELALYAPGLGYYSAGARKFGAAGDFITAPELSELFSRCLARQCQQVLAGTGGDILELGAGSGIMAAVMLKELEALDCLPEQYLILELSAELRQRQQQTLAQHTPGLLDRVQWLDQLPVTPIQGVVLANEVLDALPVERFRIAPQGPRPLLVQSTEGQFQYSLGGEDADLNAWLQALQQTLGSELPTGYESERNPYLSGWIDSLADSLQHGVMLFIDYGYPAREYYHPERRTGTLLCHYRHRAHTDPFFYPGLQDISASVDFTALAEAVIDANLDLLGYTSQNYFLFGCGLERLLAEVNSVDQQNYWRLAQQVKQLTLPGAMGDRFKVLACGRGFDSPLCGFSFRDERFRL